MTRVKICGLSRLDDALAAAEAGADYLGILFEPRSRRRLDEDVARDLVQAFRERWSGSGPQWVGVFANQPLEEVNRLLTHCDMDLAQLSGQESTEYCAQVCRPVVKVVHVRSDAPQDNVLEDVQNALTAYRESGCMLMLDTYKEGVLGGTGQAFNWEVGRELARSHSIVLAGGLSAENVTEAISRVRPWGLDVSSGVETDGRKDEAKIVRFIEQVQRTDRELSLGSEASR
ncbi:MAG: phosphoribosylanthranilate isomerase [Chloroflexota bacterium]|nr:phosphoribosylanthranilate isomerase [Chloroflexota bacterium]MDE2941689.1 phosphoribosylanthranilate isomerase [Chloroflexota bacterium]MDE3267140.1 phosphoribosylanthranilate isomerase [Chloroflexota bacterium]